MVKISLVENWRELWRAWTMWFAAFGIAIPDLLQVVADNTTLLPGIDDSMKNAIRLACLVLVVLARPIKQVKVSGE